MGNSLEIEGDERKVRRDLEDVFFEKSINLNRYSDMENSKKSVLKSNKDVYLLYKSIKSIQVEPIFALIYGVLR